MPLRVRGGADVRVAVAAVPVINPQPSRARNWRVLGAPTGTATAAHVAQGALGVGTDRSPSRTRIAVR
jgi:hypothetical protein